MDFSNGTQGWQGLQGPDGIGTVVDNSTGNGTPGLHTDYAFIGALFWNNANQSFLGDYTSSKSISLGIDVNTHSIDSGYGDGMQLARNMVVELRHYTTPSDASKFISVWHTLGPISNSSGPVHFSASIADTGSASLVSGWQVYNPQTGSPTLPDGTTFSGVLSHVDEVLFETLVPGFGYDPAHYDVTVDNISIKSAVPEPEQLAMLLAGLGVVGTVARRRRPVAATA